MATKKLTVQEFVVKAIEAGATSRSKGIHVVYSGFNAAFKSYFDSEPRGATAELATQGVIAVHPCRGGAMIYKAADAPEPRDLKGDKLLASMGAA